MLNSNHIEYLCSIPYLANKLGTDEDLVLLTPSEIRSISSQSTVPRQACHNFVMPMLQR